MNIECKDLAGKEITPGCFIVYAALWSRSAVLKYGIVVRLDKRKQTYGGSKEIPTLRVITVDRTGRWDESQKYLYSWNFQNHGKEIILSFLDRVIVISKNDMPKEVLDLLSTKENK